MTKWIDENLSVISQFNRAGISYQNIRILALLRFHSAP